MINGSVNKIAKETAQDIWNDLIIDIVPANTCVYDDWEESVISVFDIKRVLEKYGVDFDWWLK